MIPHVKGWVDLFLGLMAATATALLLALIARDHGMSASMVREDALFAASVMAGVLAGVSWRSLKQKL
jgi:hypothetical protein